MTDRTRAGYAATCRQVAAVAAVAFAGVILSAGSGHAAPFASCDDFAILYQYPSGSPPTQVHQVDVVTGADSYPTNPVDIPGRRINAIGYNVKDRFVYGWDVRPTAGLVRVHGDHTTVDDLTIDHLPGTYDPVGHTVIIGDVDSEGHYWYIDSTTNQWVQLDLTTTPNPTFVARGAVTGITGALGFDWAYLPGTDKLWRIMDDSGVARLWSFDRSSTSWTNHTPDEPLPHITDPSDLEIGAVYADRQGHLYGSSNDSGNIWRVDVSDPVNNTALLATGPSAGDNDGARCVDAAINIDFGDAPSPYHTLVADDGPRHRAFAYDDTDQRAALMLGKELDVEPDGFPGMHAKGDDDNNIDDEEGVTHIVVAPGAPTALSIPVIVTNASDQPATLAGWVDFDGSTTFDAGERVTASVPASAGTATHELVFPTTTFTDDTMARFRVFQGAIADPQPTGAVAGGEVEDVLVQVGSYEVAKTSSPTSGADVSPGEEVSYTLTVTNTGLFDLLGLTIHDNLSGVLDDAALVGDPVVAPASAGTASVEDDLLQVDLGDVFAGQTVTVTYSVRVDDSDSLGDRQIHNLLVATHSNCPPEIADDQLAAADGPSCHSEHTVHVPQHVVPGSHHDHRDNAGGSGELPHTGSGMVLPVVLVGSLLGASGVALLRLGRPRPRRQNRR